MEKVEGRTIRQTYLYVRLSRARDPLDSKRSAYYTRCLAGNAQISGKIRDDTDKFFEWIVVWYLSSV